MQGSVKALTTALSINTSKRQNMQSYKIQKKIYTGFTQNLVTAYISVEESYV